MAVPVEAVEVRRTEHGGEDVRVIVDVGRRDVTLQILSGGTRSSHKVSHERLAAITAPLQTTTIPPVPATHAAGTRPIGWELTVTSGLTQTVFRWVGDPPQGWEAAARVAADVLALARSFSMS